MISLMWVLDFSYLFILFYLFNRPDDLFDVSFDFSYFFTFSTGLMISSTWVHAFFSLLSFFFYHGSDNLPWHQFSLSPELCAIRQSYVTLEKIDKNPLSSSSLISHQSRFSLILLHMYSFSPRWHKTADKCLGFSQMNFSSCLRALRWLIMSIWRVLVTSNFYWMLDHRCNSNCGQVLNDSGGQRLKISLLPILDCICHIISHLHPEDCVSKVHLTI